MLSYSDTKNLKQLEYEKSIFLEIQRIGNIFGSSQSLFNKVYSVYDRIKDDLENENYKCIIFFIFLFFKEKNINCDNLNEYFKKYITIFKESLNFLNIKYLNDNDSRILVTFYTYFELMLDPDLNLMKIINEY